MCACIGIVYDAQVGAIAVVVVNVHVPDYDWAQSSVRDWAEHQAQAAQSPYQVAALRRWSSPFT